jgi:OmpA-OmpF porin, OOP family
MGGIFMKRIMLIKMGIQPDRIKTIGYGYSKPLSDNSTRQGRQHNRRVEAETDYIIKK